ncbi:MAG TPA: MlaD family protein [Solirubrobacteraceae bacterium]|nr:MlaD family protein [Solirubrobacteraceae bacterium]
MSGPLRERVRAVVMIALLIVLATVVSLYILSNQNLTGPSWMPVIGKDHFRIDARFTSAAGVMPGQGQAVTISGVKVGQIAGVRVDGGTAVLSLDIERRFARVRPDATLLLRPKTGLKDMVVELDPGTPASGPLVKEGATLGTRATAPDVNFEEILASLDTDTRTSLQLLLTDGGKALGDGGGRRLANTLRRFEPLSRHAAQATKLVARRRTKLKRLMGNLSKIAGELGSRDHQLGRFVDSSAAVFRRFANQNERLAQTLELAPAALASSTTALGQLDRLGTTLRTGLDDLAPGAKALGPTLRQVQPFLGATTPVLRDQLRPFAREAQPTARKLVPAARDLAQATPKLAEFTDVLNAIFDEMAYDPPGNDAKGQSYLFYVPWAGHNTNSMLSSQDGIGATRRGLVLFSCGSLELFKLFASPRRNPTLSTLLQLLNAPVFEEVCKPREAPPG